MHRSLSVAIRSNGDSPESLSKVLELSECTIQSWMNGTVPIPPGRREHLQQLYGEIDWEADRRTAAARARVKIDKARVLLDKLDNPTLRDALRASKIHYGELGALIGNSQINDYCVGRQRPDPGVVVKINEAMGIQLDWSKKGLDASLHRIPKRRGGRSKKKVNCEPVLTAPTSPSSPTSHDISKMTLGELQELATELRKYPLIAEVLIRELQR